MPVGDPLEIGRRGAIGPRIPGRVARRPDTDAGFAAVIRVPAMSTARWAAPEIDRLVLSVNGAVGPRHGERLLGVAREAGLDALAPLPNLAGFIRAGTLTDEIATLRMRYADPAAILANLGDLVDRGVLERRGDRYVAAERLLPLLDALDEAVTDVASSTWARHGELVEAVSTAAARIGAAAGPDHVVAVTRRDLGDPDDPSFRLLGRLITVRLIRQHDHAVSWIGRHLTAAEMPVMTDLWHGDAVEPDRPGLGALVERGYAEVDPVRLTARGRRVRDAIEDDTNALAQRAFDALGEDDGAEFVDGLRRLPSATD